MIQRHHRHTFLDLIGTCLALALAGDLLGVSAMANFIACAMYGFFVAEFHRPSR